MLRIETKQGQKEVNINRIQDWLARSAKNCSGKAEVYKAPL